MQTTRVQQQQSMTFAVPAKYKIIVDFCFDKKAMRVYLHQFECAHHIKSPHIYDKGKGKFEVIANCNDVTTVLTYLDDLLHIPNQLR